MDEKVWLTSGQVADMIGVTTTTLGNWERTGILIPERKLESGHRRYSVQQIDSFKSKWGSAYEKED